MNLPFKITPEMRSHYRSIWSNQATTLEHWVILEANQIRRSLTSMICFLQQGQRNGGRGEGPSFPPWYFCLLLHTRKFLVTALLYEMPSNSMGKIFVWKIYCFFPLNLRVLPATDSDGSTCRFWGKYLQKVNAKRPQISDEK